ncbi:hypothetical protein EV702DRAFT_1146702 [Suillus placidus]|uniref:Uncharacterized protein n=1 Tax=Suillus placidus TaxID=48579 RepID=A0A9P7CXA6_9AGAM|nr:hypothetical protein EV702DRAFT_1146702 [Suillus placidus]
MTACPACPTHLLHMMRFIRPYQQIAFGVNDRYFHSYNPRKNAAVPQFYLASVKSSRLLIKKHCSKSYWRSSRQSLIDGTLVHRMASKSVYRGRGRRHQWGDITVRAEAAIMAEVIAEETEARAEGTEASLGFWKRGKSCFWPGNRDRTRRSRVALRQGRRPHWASGRRGRAASGPGIETERVTRERKGRRNSLVSVTLNSCCQSCTSV